MATIDLNLGLNLTGAVDLPQVPLGSALAFGPTPAAWAALNQTVGGRLHVGEPWAKPCFSIFNEGQIQPDTGACEEIQKTYFNNHSA